jgi:hypothetical protein
MPMRAYRGQAGEDAAAGDGWFCLWAVDLPPCFGQKFAPNRQARRVG